MDYKETLSIVKAQNPDLSHNECKKKASELYQAYKANQKDLQKKLEGDGSVPPSKQKTKDEKVSSAVSEQVASPDIIDAEKAIKKGPIDVNKIMSIGMQVIPNGQIVKYGKHGPNTLVAWEDNAGNRLPVEGFFEIFL
jgi:hypothetical protein